MNKSKLIWFAAGVAVSSLVSTATILASPDREPERGWTLYITEGVQSMRDDEESARWQGAEIARGCGVRSLDLTPGIGSDDGDFVSVPLVIENNPAMACLLDRLGRAGISLGLQIDPIGQ